MGDIKDIYGSPAPSKSRSYTEPQPLLTEDEVRQRMSDISRWVETERQKMRDALETLAKREPRVQLGITFLEPDLFYKAEAKKYVTAAKENGTKLTVADKEAIIMLELEDEKMNYDLAKFDAETSDNMFKKLEPQNSFYQSLLKLR